MSGTVPPPPPPPPGRAPEPEGTPEPGVPPRIQRVPSAYRMPPSISPSGSGEVPVQRVPAPDVAPTAAHRPIPPAPEPTTPATPTSPSSPASPSPPADAPTQAWAVPPAGQQPVHGYGQQPYPQHHGYGQPGYGQAAYSQPTQQQPGAQAPGAYAPGVAATGAQAGAWWGDQWNGAAAQPPQQVPPAGYGAGGPAYAAAGAAPVPAAAHPGPAGAAGGTAGGRGGGKDGRTRRGGLTPGWIAFIAVDALLLVVAVVFAFQIFGGGSPRMDEAGPGAGAQAGQEAGDQGEDAAGDEQADDAADAEVLARFASPSRNITCQITSAGASCGIAELDQQPAPVEGCDGTTGYVVALDGEGQVSLPCVPSSEQPKKAPGSADVLEYGESVTEGDYTCSSAETGMSCTYDPSGRGFSLARAGIGTF